MKFLRAGTPLVGYAARVTIRPVLYGGLCPVFQRRDDDDADDDFLGDN